MKIETVKIDRWGNDGKLHGWRVEHHLSIGYDRIAACVNSLNKRMGRVNVVGYDIHPDGSTLLVECA